jgi:hypothetical protein
LRALRQKKFCTGQLTRIDYVYSRQQTDDTLRPYNPQTSLRNMLSCLSQSLCGKKVLYVSSSLVTHEGPQSDTLHSSQAMKLNFHNRNQNNWCVQRNFSMAYMYMAWVKNNIHLYLNVRGFISPSMCRLIISQWIVKVPFNNKIVRTEV